MNEKRFAISYEIWWKERMQATRRMNEVADWCLLLPTWRRFPQSGIRYLVNGSNITAKEVVCHRCSDYSANKKRWHLNLDFMRKQVHEHDWWKSANVCSITYYTRRRIFCVCSKKFRQHMQQKKVTAVLPGLFMSKNGTLRFSLTFSSDGLYYISVTHGTFKMTLGGLPTYCTK